MTEAIPPPAGAGPPAPLSKPPVSPAAAPKKEWSEADWEAFLRVAGPIGKYLVEAWKWKAAQDAVQEEQWDQRAFWTLVLLMGFLGSIIVLMSVLVVYGKVSGDALLFLVGAVASWILFASQRYLFESEEEDQKPLL
jgi:hypothetical protein